MFGFKYHDLMRKAGLQQGDITGLGNEVHRPQGHGMFDI